MQNKLIKYFSLFLILMFCYACNEPKSTEVYIGKADIDSLGLYSCSLPVTDSLCAYNVDLYCVISCDDNEFLSFKDISTKVSITFRDSCILNKAVNISKDNLIYKSFYTKAFLKTIDSNFICDSLGSLNIKIDPIQGYKTQGFGIRLNKINIDGTQKVN